MPDELGRPMVRCLLTLPAALADAIDGERGDRTPQGWITEAIMLLLPHDVRENLPERPRRGPRPQEKPENNDIECRADHVSRSPVESRKRPASKKKAVGGKKKVR